MTRRFKIWLAVDVLFTLGNLAGGVFAAAQGEVMHSGVHVALFLLGAYVAERMWQRWKSPTAGSLGRPADQTAMGGQLDEHLTHLEQSIDAVSIELERVGEGQRFITQILSEKGIRGTASKGAAEPVEARAPEAPPARRY